jgi:hypothetical protein
VTAFWESSHFAFISGDEVQVDPHFILPDSAVEQSLYMLFHIVLFAKYRQSQNSVAKTVKYLIILSIFPCPQVLLFSRAGNTEQRM